MLRTAWLLLPDRTRAALGKAGFGAACALFGAVIMWVTLMLFAR